MVDDNGIETPILFPQTLKHDVVASQMDCEDSLISAGFVRLGPAGMVQVSGHSHNLNLSSRPEDEDIIAKWLTFEGA